MKTPPRSFVVEYKSSRRRLVPQQNAVWGNVDFKSLVREAEADAPHLFPTAVVSGEPGVIDQAPHRILEASLLVKMADAETSCPADVSAASRELREEQFSLAAIETLIAGVIDTSPKISTQTHGRRFPELVPALQSTKIEKPAPTAPQDDLAMLEHENQRLKEMLVAHLRQQNSQLTQMLLRFAH